MRIAKISYGIGYGRHADELEFEDEATDAEIEEVIREYVMEKLDWGFVIENEDEAQS